jgi:hypothetical protein
MTTADARRHIEAALNVLRQDKIKLMDRFSARAYLRRAISDLDAVDSKLDRIQSAAGNPDPAEACRIIIGLAKEARGR